MGGAIEMVKIRLVVRDENVENLHDIGISDDTKPLSVASRSRGLGAKVPSVFGKDLKSFFSLVSRFSLDQRNKATKN